VARDADKEDRAAAWCPLTDQEFRFYRYRPDGSVLTIEINAFPETPREVLPEP
jgi:hypothetical protein